MIIKACDFDFAIVRNAETQPRKKGNQGTKKRREYKDLVCAFDTETSYIEELDENIIYVWQFQVDEYYTVIGRTVAELKQFFISLDNAMHDNQFLVVYVHNLSYDWQFIRCLFDIQPDSVFAVKSRKVLKCDILGHIELRCSYLHCNMSLDAYTNKFNVKHKKLSGAKFDYSKVRYPDTPLTDYELEYSANDVIGLVEALKCEMQLEHDNLYTIPLTSTGYVRRDVKQALRDFPRNQMRELFPKGELFELLRDSFRGGNTHANRYFTKNDDFMLDPVRNVHSIDRSSSYPDVIVNYKFPMTAFHRVDKKVDFDTLVNHYIEKRGYAIVTRLRFGNIRLKDRFYPCPYISLSKCKTPPKRRDYILDNGRILQALDITIAVNDIDLKIITSQYEWDTCEVEILYFARYRYLPDSLRDLVREYYKQKTGLKGIEGQELYYAKFKNLINAIFGCMAQNPAKEKLVYHQELEGDELFLPDGTTQGERLEAAYPVMPYQWGCWVTAWARYLLQLCIDAVHNTPGCEFVYTDTDSVKYIGDFDIDTFNKPLFELSMRNNAFAYDKAGNIHYLGIYEYEGTYDRFETKGAKNYMYQDKTGIHITIAGVPKSKGANELVRRARIERRLRHDKTDAFTLYKDGLVFSDGITLTTYNDRHEPKDIEIDGHKITLTSNITILPNTHEIGLAADYKWLLDHLGYKKLAQVLIMC